MCPLQLSELSTSNETSLGAAKERLDHLQAIQEVTTISSPDFQEWARVRLSRQIADYLLRRGYLDAAATLARTENIEPMVDTALFKECAKIEDCLKRRSVSEALSWCKENQSTLKKMKVRSIWVPNLC